MSSNLFVDLSDHEQEAVAGGIATIANISRTDFFSHLKLSQANGIAVAGPNGASANGTITGVDQVIHTSGFNSLFAAFD